MEKTILNHLSFLFALTKFIIDEWHIFRTQDLLKYLFIQFYQFYKSN